MFLDRGLDKVGVWPRFENGLVGFFVFTVFVVVSCFPVALLFSTLDKYD